MKRTIWFLMVSLLFLVGLEAIAIAQEEQEEATPEEETTETVVLPPPPVEKKPDSPEAYDINYSYDPGGRRDPFVSLLGGTKSKTASIPKGALTVADAKVVGITRAKEGFVAIIIGSDKKARFMKEGDKLFDGQIIQIQEDRVIFRQDLTDDALAAPGLKSKEVIKRLHPVQEGT
jgi:hypothetical protein